MLLCNVSPIPSACLISTVCSAKNSRHDAVYQSAARIETPDSATSDQPAAASLYTATNVGHSGATQWLRAVAAAVVLVVVVATAARCHRSRCRTRSSSSSNDGSRCTSSSTSSTSHRFSSPIASLSSRNGSRSDGCCFVSSSVPAPKPVGKRFRVRSSIRNVGNGAGRQCTVDRYSVKRTKTKHETQTKRC